LRIALVLRYFGSADGEGREPTTVSVPSLVNALKLVEDFLKPHARRVVVDAALAPVEKDAAALARYIVKQGSGRINARDIQQNGALPTFKRRDNVEAATEALMETNWLFEAPSRQGDTPGKQRKDFLVNPAVHGGANG
jgi:hypothetical protein